jgi:hypothetical protein
MREMKAGERETDCMTCQVPLAPAFQKTQFSVLPRHGGLANTVSYTLFGILYLMLTLSIWK